MDGGLALQGALLTRLNADPGVQALLGNPPRIYDYVPEAEDPLGIFPFVAIGDMSLVRWRNLSLDGFTGTLTLDIFSEYRGWKEAMDILTALQSAIESSPLIVAGMNIVRFEYRNHHRLHQPDGRSRHVPMMLAVEAQYVG